MSGVNKAIILGRLGQDPETRYTADGKAITNISIATSETWKDKQGNKQESTEWHRVVFFGKLAEIAGEYLKKGSQAYIEGKIKTRKWQDKQGQDKYTTEIQVDSFSGVLQMLGEKSGAGQQQQNQQPPSQPQEQGFDNSFDSDIPFAPLGLSNKSLLYSI